MTDNLSDAPERQIGPSAETAKSETLPVTAQTGPAASSEAFAPTNAKAAKLKTVASDIYGTFWIDKTEFAVPVDAIQEVVNEPENISEVPLSEDHMTGLFNLRGMIVPLVELRVMLGFEPAPASAQRKVAIIESGAFRIGLLFDKTGEIIYGDTGTRINFEPNSGGIRDVVVEGLLKLDDGQRMVQVLNPYELLNIEKLPRIAKGEENAAASELGKRLSCISFQLGHTICALDLRCVQEVMDVPPIEKSRLTHGPVLGTINLRGYTLPVIDFRSVIGKEAPFSPSPEALKTRKLLILNLPEGRIGLLVYSIDSIVTYFESELLPFAKVALPRHDVVAGCLVNEFDQIVILLDDKMLMSDAELARAARSCQEIYPPQLQVEEKETDKHANQRRTFILFSIERCFALDTSCVCEVINKPDKLLTPPYALKFVEGIVNLRGELITLIDPKRLYNMTHTSKHEQKVMIFHQAGQKYGILIDTVDEIVMTTDGHVVDVPSIGESDMTRAISEDVTGCLSVSSRDIGSDPVLILNVESLVKRCMNFDAEAMSA